jgi:hypothetical protein
MMRKNRVNVMGLPQHPPPEVQPGYDCRTMASDGMIQKENHCMNRKLVSIVSLVIAGSVVSVPVPGADCSG